MLIAAAGAALLSAQPAAPPPPPVEIVTVSSSSVPIFTEYPAQTFARNLVEVRGRVEGYIEKWLFKPGSEVRAGQALYVLDTRPYEAAVAQATGNLQQSEADLQFASQQVSLLQAEANLSVAQANQLRAQQDYERLKPLVEQDAAPRQELETAAAALAAAQANVKAIAAARDQARISTQTQIAGNEGKVAALKGALQTAKLNVEYGTINAPIGGLIGDSLIPVGGLVTPGSPTPLATIVPLDPMYVRFKISETEFLAMRDRLHSSALGLQMLLANGVAYPQRGQIENTQNQIDPKTGTLEVQARFPNPQHTLLPGQYARVRYQTATRNNVILIPQRAVQQVQSLQTVYVLTGDNKATVRPIVTAERVGDEWIVTQGLQPGDRVIVEGALRVRPGSVVNPTAYRKPAGK